MRHIKMLILDEVDELLNRGFKDQIYDVYRYLPSVTQVVLLSATLPYDVLEMTTKHQYVLCYSRSSLRTSRRSGRRSVSIGHGSSSTYPRRRAAGTVAPPKVPPVRATPPHPRPRSLCYAPSRNSRGPHPIKQSSVRQKTCQECRRGARIAQSGALCTFLHESSPPSCLWTLLTTLRKTKATIYSSRRHTPLRGRSRFPNRAIYQYPQMRRLTHKALARAYPHCRSGSRRWRRLAERGPSQISAELQRVQAGVRMGRVVQ
jgi:hypothetical protein